MKGDKDKSATGLVGDSPLRVSQKPDTKLRLRWLFVMGNKERTRLFVRMPRFYFDTYDDDRSVPDGQGLQEAREEAIKALPDMARDGLPGGDCREFVVDVRD